MSKAIQQHFLHPRAYEEHITNGCGTNPLIYCPDDLVTRTKWRPYYAGLVQSNDDSGADLSHVDSGESEHHGCEAGRANHGNHYQHEHELQTGDTVTVPSGMLAVSNVAAKSATSITAMLTANPNVAVGPQALVATSGGQNLTLPLAIEVGTY